MKLRFAFFFLLVINCRSCYCENIALLGSPYVSDPSYKYYVITEGVNPPSTVQVSLRTDGNQIERTTIDDFSSDLIESEFEVKSSNKYDLKVSSTKCNQSMSLTKTSEQSMIFIYLNKPIYKTGEEINFKVFVLDQKMIPMNKQMEITIFDSNRNAVKKIEDAKGGDFGIFQDSHPIADDPYLGSWMIQVMIGEKNVTKSFEVQKYNEGDIEVLIEAPSVIAHSDRRLYMTLHAKSSDGNLVRGTASISVTGSFIGKKDVAIEKPNFKIVNLESAKTSINFDIVDNLDIRFPTADMTLKFKVEVTETSSQASKVAEKEIKLKHKGKNVIQVIGKKYFKPSFKHPIKIRVKTLDGKPDNSFNQLSMNIQYINDMPSTAQTYSINLKNGETSQYLQPSKDTKKIIVSLEFAESTLVKEIEAFPTFGVNEYMQVTVVSKGIKVGDQVRLSVNATEEMNELNLIVFGLQGIVHSNKFPDSVDKDEFEVTFGITEEMKPEARGIVFYVKDGVIIYDEFSISLGFSISNSIELTASKEAKPNAETTIGVKTEENSTVILTAIDSLSALLKRNFEISRTDIYSELSYYLNKKFPGASRYHFEKINAFVLEPIKDCGTELSSRSSFNTDDDEEVTETEAHQYFPNALPELVFISTSSELENKIMQVPNSLSTIKLSAISVHKTKGLTVPKVQSEIAVKNEVLIQIEAPALIRTNEIVRARATAFNFKKSQQDAKIVITIENGFFMDEKKDAQKNCLTFSKINKDSKTFDQVILPDGKPQTVSFLISTDKLEPVKITAKVTTDESNYEAQRVIKVFGLRSMIKFVKKSNLIETQGSNKFEEAIGDAKYATLYGNLFGPAMNGLEAIFNKTMVLPEEKILKFATSLLIHKFTSLKNFHNETVNQKAVKDMMTSYQEALPILQKIINSNRKSQVWFASFITGILIDATEVIAVDKKLIEESLHFIKSQLIGTETFDYNKDDDLHRDINNTDERSTVQAALIAATFLKNKDEFGNEITKLLKFIKNKKFVDNQHYVKAVVAYTLALNGEIQEAKKVMPKSESYNSQNMFPKDKSPHVELLSYVILTKILANEDPKSDVRLLINTHRNADGGFYSPYDTFLGLQALYEYTKFKDVATSNAQYEIGENNGTLNKFDSVTLKVSKDDSVKLNGDALAYASFYYHKEEKQIFKLFHLTREDSTGINNSFTRLEFSTISLISSMVVLEVEVPRGYRYVKHVERNAIVNQVELQNHGTVAVFYINKMEKNIKYSIDVEFSKIYDFYKTDSRISKIYNYYRPNAFRLEYHIQDTNAINCDKEKT